MIKDFQIIILDYICMTSWYQSSYNITFIELCCPTIKTSISINIMCIFIQMPVLLISGKTA